MGVSGGELDFPCVEVDDSIGESDDCFGEDEFSMGDLNFAENGVCCGSAANGTAPSGRCEN